MATKLLGTLTFTSVAGSASSSQSHGLNVDGVAVTPDFLYPSTTGAFTVTATSTTVTVTNLGNVATTIVVACEYKHSAVRVTGDGSLTTPITVQTGGELYRGAARYIYVNPTTGSDTTGTGTILLPYATITYALSTLGRILTGPHVIVLTGTTLHREQIDIPSFESSEDYTYDYDNTPVPLTLWEYPVTIAADLRETASTTLGVVSWVADSPTGLLQLTVTGLSVSADALVGQCIIGAGNLEVAWVGRNTATSGGQTTLNLSTDTELTEPVQLATPIEVKAPDGTATSTATITGRQIHSGLSLQGLKISHPGTSSGRSVALYDHSGDFYVAGCNLAHGYYLQNVANPQFYQCQFGSGVNIGSATVAARSLASVGFSATYTYCLFKAAHFLTLDRAGAEGVYWCYLRQCNDAGHGGGTYLGGTPFDFLGVWIDQQTGAASRSGVNYNGGARASLDSCRIENCETGVTVSEAGGGLRVKNVVGTNTIYGIRVGDRTSPFLGGGGVVRISSTTAVTGGTADTFIGEIGQRSYAAIRAAFGKSLIDPCTGSRIWEP